MTPPVGMNLFVVKAAAPSTSMSSIYRAILPFLAADVIRLTLIATLPALSLYLVKLAYG
ncbi:TRAP transporter large permease subunit [Shimia aestuarii]|nr:TRAP transporter large permease subunit [Shimia aestuarii]